MRLAIIGFGSRISHVFANLKAVAGDRLQLVGWADVDAKPPGLTRVPEAGRGFTDHREMLATLRPDAVMIGSPNHLHLTHIRDALEAGAKVFSEKPVVITPEESWEAAHLLAKYGQERFLVGLVLRSSPLFRKALATVRSGRIGKPVSMEANELLSPEHGGFIARDWRRHRAYSGSHLLEKCCHDIDLHQALLGGRIVRAASFGGRSVFVPENQTMKTGERYGTWSARWGTDPGGNPFTAESDIVDHQVFVAEVEGGARLSFHCNNHVPFGQRRWVLCGVKGAWESDFDNGRIRIQEAFGTAEVIEPPANGGGHYGADTAMAQDLYDAWFKGTAFPVPTRAAIEAGLAAMGIDQAQRTGTVFDLTPWWAKLDAILGKPEAATKSTSATA